MTDVPFTAQCAEVLGEREKQKTQLGQKGLKCVGGETKLQIEERSWWLEEGKESDIPVLPLHPTVSLLPSLLFILSVKKAFPFSSFNKLHPS